MSYGFELYNENGDLFMRDLEDAYMYWGKATVTGTVSTPFNIPTSVRTMAFYVSDTVDRVVLPANTGGLTGFRLRHAEVTTSPNLGSATVYIFIHALDYPRENWGMEIYKPNGELQYHSAAPPLRVQDMFNGILYDGGSDVSSSRKVAVPVMVTAAIRISTGVNSHQEWETRTYCFEQSSGNYLIGTRKIYLSAEDAPASPASRYLGTTFNMIGLDAAYFDTVASKGNY